MKIAIMTLPLGKNYGGIMQAWALQQVLKRMGHQPVTIDRQPDQPGLTFKAARLVYRAGMKAVGKRKAPINIEKYLPVILQHTQSFIDKHITMSAPLYSTQQLRDHFDCENYDAVIVGSDQTWRPLYSPCIEDFFLGFLKDRRVRRIAYASSFGVEHWEFTNNQTGKCRALAQHFNAIGVREVSGIDLCREHLKVHAVHTLDPTLLLNEKDYRALLEKGQKSACTTDLFTYFLDPSPGYHALLDRLGLGSGTGTDVSPQGTRPRRNDTFSRNDWSDRNIMPPVEEWLASFVNTDRVVTDSFHGSVFSIIFNKPFIPIINRNRGAARFTSLLKPLHFPSTIALASELAEGNSFLTVQARQHEALERLREDSLKFLEDALK